MVSGDENWWWRFWLHHHGTFFWFAPIWDGVCMCIWLKIGRTHNVATWLNTWWLTTGFGVYLRFYDKIHISWHDLCSRFRFSNAAHNLRTARKNRSTAKHLCGGLVLKKITTTWPQVVYFVWSCGEQNADKSSQCHKPPYRLNNFTIAVGNGILYMLHVPLPGLDSQRTMVWF